MQDCNFHRAAQCLHYAFVRWDSDEILCRESISVIPRLKSQCSYSFANDLRNPSVPLSCWGQVEDYSGKFDSDKLDSPFGFVMVSSVVFFFCDMIWLVLFYSFHGFLLVFFKDQS